MARRLRLAKCPSMVPQEKFNRSSKACHPAISMVSRGLSVGMDSARRTSLPIGGLGGPTIGGGGIGLRVGVGTGRRAGEVGVRGGTDSLFFYLGWGWSQGQRKLPLLGISWRDLPPVGQGLWAAIEAGEEGRDPVGKEGRR